MFFKTNFVRIVKIRHYKVKVNAGLMHSYKVHLLTCLEKKPFQNIMGKGENLVTSIFSFSHNVFYKRQKLSFMLHLFCCLQILSIWTRSNFCRLGMGYAKLSKTVSNLFSFLLYMLNTNRKNEHCNILF